MPSKISQVLPPLREDVERLERIMALLETESERTIRADLAEELVRESSRLEDAKERTLFPLLEKAGFSDSVERMRASTEKARSAMEPVFAATRHTAPIDVHVHDPEAFERDVEQLCLAIRTQRGADERELVVISQQLSPEQQRQLSEALRDGLRHAVGRPHPAHNPVFRTLERMVDKIDRNFPDTAAQYRPGRDKLGA